MKNRITITFLIILVIKVYSQTDSANYIPYYNLVSRAKYYEYINQPDKAISEYIKAFKLVPKVFPFDKFHLARCYAMKKDTLKVMNWLLQAIEEGFFYNYNKEIRTDSLFDFLGVSHKIIISKADEDAFQYYHNTDVKENIWNDSIKYFFYNDAIFRSEHNKQMALKKGKNYIDSTLKNWEQLQDMEVDFILRNGYPGLLKAPFVDIFSVPLWHLTDERKVRIKPFLYEELKHGNITPDDYAGFCENLEFSTNNGDCLYYVIKTNCNAAEWPKIISNRESIGLSLYLDQGDYIPYQMKRRQRLPWIINER